MNQKGFTLVETLVAFAILALVLVAAYRTAGTGLRTIDAAATTEGAVLAAQSEMDRILALRQLPGPRAGRIEGTAYSWSLEVLSPDPAWSQAPLARKAARLRLTVSWPARSGTSSIRLERVVFLAGSVAP